jgi:hypothetical protein
MSDVPDPIPTMIDVPVDSGTYSVTFGADGRPIRHFSDEDPAAEWARFRERIESRKSDPGYACPYPGCSWYVRGRGAAAGVEYTEHVVDVHVLASR